MDPILAELITQLVRNGALEQEDISEIADRLKHSGKVDEAYSVQVCYVEAHFPSPEEEAAEQRSQMRLVHDGGNSEI